MVAIEELADEESSSPSPSQERLLDADDIEKILSQLRRPTAKMQVESLIKKIRKEASALKAIESISKSTSSTSTSTSTAAPTPSTAATAKTTNAAPSSAPAPPLAKPISTTVPMNTPSVMYNTIDRFAFDAGGSSDKFVTLYLPLPGVGSVPDKKEQIQCEFGKTSFDVTVTNLSGKNYRLKRDDLEHDIDPEKSKRIVKADKIVVKLHKIKGEYGSFDYWSKLTDPKKNDKSSKKSTADPSAGLMGMMKDMYDSGDDKMKKMIGETMLKQRNGELNKDSDKPGGIGDMADF